jgi:hypothetical protein
MAGWLNALRQTLGLRALLTNASVQQAAQDHANYEVVNQIGSHEETSGLPDFTGIAPNDRITALYPSDSTGEVLVYYTGYGATAESTGIATAQDLINAPFHRVVMLSDFEVMGTAFSTDYGAFQTAVHTAYVMDFAGDANSLPDNQFIVYPYAGQKGVPKSWVADETPNPFTAAPSYVGATVGYPVTIQGEITDGLTISSFTIAAGGVNVPCLEIDPNTAIGGSDLYGAALCAPYQPYTPNTQYTVTVTGTKNGQPFMVTWSWTTAA